MTINTITINSVDYVAYATRAEVNEYLAVDAVRGAAWALLADNDDTRGPFVVSATRRLDLLTWQGEKTGGALQVEAFPRTGLVYPDGTEVTTTDVPREVQDATALLSGSINLEAKVAEAGTSGSNIKGVKAGSAAVDFFRRSDGVPLQDESAFRLVQQWLEASALSDALGPLATGTDGESSFSDIDKWGRSTGFP